MIKISNKKVGHFSAAALLSNLNFILVMFPFQGLWAVMTVAAQWSKCVSKCRSIDFMCFTHAFVTEVGSCILNKSNMVAKFHTKASGTFDAGVCYHTNEDDFLDSPLLEL